MKIAVVCENINLKGGIARYVAEVAGRLCLRDTVHVFASSWSGLDGLKFHIHRVFCIKRPLLVEVASFAAFSTNELGKHDFDVIYSQGVSCLRPDVVVMQSCHKAYYEEVGKKQTIKTVFDPVHKVLLALERYVVEKGSRKIIAISNVVKEEMLRYYDVKPSKIEVIHSGVNLEEFNPGNRKKHRAGICKRYGLASGDVVLVFVGWEFERKGLRCILEAMGRMKDRSVRLLVVGNGNIPRYKRIAEGLGIGEQVFFVGPSANVAEYYAAGDVFVFPTLYEPFGLVITEAMASGLPVVVSKLAGAAEIIRDRHDGMLLSDPSDAKELAGALTELAGSREMRAKMGAAARKTAERYSWDSVTEKTSGVFSAMAKGG